MSSSVWVLIGEGPNNVEIPCLIWTSFDIAIDFCVNTFGKVYSFNSSDSSRRWVCEGDEFQKQVLEKMYKRYYGGCGECYAVTLIQVEEGKPFVGWDLD